MRILKVTPILIFFFWVGTIFQSMYSYFSKTSFDEHVAENLQLGMYVLRNCKKLYLGTLNANVVNNIDKIMKICKNWSKYQVFQNCPNLNVISQF
jgi:hypothetical protein